VTAPGSPETTAARLRDACPTISVGLVTADWMSLASELAAIERAGVRLLHIDVMDGCFCPMMTLGPPVIKAIRTSMLKDVHLMIDEPLDKLESYAAAGADLITISVESTVHPHRVLQALGKMTNANDPDRAIARGVCLNPGTPVAAVEPLLAEVDIVFLLAVNPGWGGQKLIGSTPQRVAEVRRMIRDSGREILIGVDGGITRDNIGDVARMGADIMVTGSAVFDGGAPAENARFMLGEVAKAGSRS
jgi:ribulose-phosphate 3-epimerase